MHLSILKFFSKSKNQIPFLNVRKVYVYDQTTTEVISALLKEKTEKKRTLCFGLEAFE